MSATSVPTATTMVIIQSYIYFKVVWFKVLEKWRLESQRKGSIPKEVFPTLLTKVCNQLEMAGGGHLVSGKYISQHYKFQKVFRVIMFLFHKFANYTC